MIPEWPQRPWPEAVPRFVTPRNLERQTLGPELGEVALRLGFRLMPWQQRMFDTLYELDDDGALWYTEARIATPRRSSKTTSMLIRHVDRMLNSEKRGWGRRPQTAATAQSATDMRDMFRNEWMPVVESAELAEWKRNLLANGNEAIEWDNGGRMITFPPNGKGGHGKTLDAADLDECFAFVDGRAETGVRHAMDTRFSPQLVLSSTAGTNESFYWREKIEDGRERCVSGDHGHVYTLEYSAGPEDDVNNPEHWPRWMPALGYTVPMKRALSEHGVLPAEEWLRAWCNLWTGATEQIIPDAVWAAIAVKRPRTYEGRRWLSVDVAPGSKIGSAASISVATRVGDEIHVQVLSHGAGTAWVADKVGELTREHKVRGVWVESIGPIGQIVADIRRKSAVHVVELDTSDSCNASARFLQAAIDGTVKHYDQDKLNAAVAGAAKRTVGDRWSFGRRKSTADISPLMSASFAHWAACQEPAASSHTIYSGRPKEAAVA